MADNQLYYGDNLDVLRRHIADESVDLVYLDPPFNSAQSYNVLFAEHGGEGAASQIRAFEDTWRWDTASAQAFEKVVESGGRVSNAMQAFRKFLGDNDMLAYLCMMAPRLVELRRVLKPTGSIYLHCDPTASHYLKMLMDAVFGANNFRNEILWYYYNKMHDSRKRMFPRATDTVFFYVWDAQTSFTFHQLKELRDKPIKQLRRKKVDGKMVNLKDDAGHVVYQMKEDRTVDNVWRIPCLQPAAPERLGYPTQKPVALLERILQASSNEGDTVLDPFCGCGTTIAAAQNLKRRWIGIDITHLAVALIKHRLRDTFGDLARYDVIGEPTSLPDAEALAASDPYQFQWWALGLVGARPVEGKKGADHGIDGKLFFHDDKEGGKTKQVIISVKAGQNVSVAMVRDLRGVIERESAEIGVLISMVEPTRPMRAEAAGAGFYMPAKEGSLGHGKYPRLQLLTVAELLDGRRIEYPAHALSTTFKRAPKAAPKGVRSKEIFDSEPDSESA